MKPSVSDESTLTDEALVSVLQEEFARLNAAFFGGRLTCPEIVISRRKTYGGYYQPHQHRIVLSLQAYREHGWEETVNTFRHEVAHIVHPNHSQKFWTLAINLGATQRYAAAPLTARARPAPRYLYACPACGRLTPRYRRLRLASCAACDKRYNPKFALRLVKE